MLAYFDDLKIIKHKERSGNKIGLIEIRFKEKKSDKTRGPLNVFSENNYTNK